MGHVNPQKLYLFPAAFKLNWEHHMGQIHGRRIAAVPIRSLNNACLYASWFLHASITIMATVCRFFPSQLVGVASTGPGDCQLTLVSSHSFTTANTVINSVFGWGVRAPYLLMPVFPSFQRLDAGRSKWPAQTPPMKVTFAGASSIWAGEAATHLSAQIEGYEYVGESLSS